MAVEPGHLAVLDPEAELGGDHDLITDRLERFPDDILIGIWAVHFGRIEERHTGVSRGADDRDPILAAQRLSVALADAHTAKTERRYLQPICAQNPFLHGGVSVVTLRKALAYRRHDSRKAARVTSGPPL